MLVIGLARSGIAAALALRAAGRCVVGVDSGEPAGARSLIDAGVELHLGTSGEELVTGVDAVVKSPGVAHSAAPVARARELGVPVLGELELAWRMLPNQFVAVTGTNGKTTTVELVGHIHRQAGVPVAVAGNIGTPLSSLVGAVGAEAIVVCEASSFQLQDTIAFAPEAAVLLNLAPDHLDRHRTLAQYADAKLQIFARQQAGDIAVVAAELAAGDPAPPPHAPAESLHGRIVAALDGPARRVRFGAGEHDELALRDGRLWWEGRALLDVEELRLRGRHNVHNAMAAAAVCLARGVDRESVRSALRSFAGVAHRLQELGRYGGVLYVNDSKATNVASTLVALDALGEHRSGEPARAGAIHLILGGQGKGQDFSPLREPVRRSCRALYLIGQDASAIAAALAGSQVPASDCGELAVALRSAADAARAGDVVLLSPACASFDQFSDFEARGDHFAQLVRRLRRGH
jgi:UDP-N-acetylmuramoylalanine--D-glutamate ligase